jgi:hypothetical protein
LETVTGGPGVVSPTGVLVERGQGRQGILDLVGLAALDRYVGGVLVGDLGGFLVTHGLVGPGAQGGDEPVVGDLGLESLQAGADLSAPAGTSQGQGSVGQVLLAIGGVEGGYGL